MVKRETIPAPPPLEPIAPPEEIFAPEIELRLSIGREGVGVEIARPATIACAIVTELAASLPGTRFPLDVSGGVARFRHRRGSLDRLTLEVRAHDVQSYAAPKLRGLLGPRSPKVRVLARPYGAAIGIADVADAEESPKPLRVLAFDLTAHAEGGDLVLCVRHVRGLHLQEPATTLALHAVQSLVNAERRGARFVMPAVPKAISRVLMPEAGARTPDSDHVAFSAITCATDTWILHAFVGAPSAAPSTDAVRANESARLLEAADDALFSRDFDHARRECLEVLARAPAHPEASARIAEIDAHAGGRAEAALALAAGHVRGVLLAETGDRVGARAALVRAAEEDEVPEMAAAAYALAASIASDASESSEWLDRAVARDPASTHVRWARARTRLDLGRIDDAMADIEHLEALARGIAAKHAVWRNAAKMFSTSGMGQRARTLFERALRYAPDEPEALLGLARTLTQEPGMESHLATRGIALALRALEMDLDEETRAEALVLLARALVTHTSDRPAAIARVRDVPAKAHVALEARGLEAKWRAEIGDLVGASLAYARLRDLAEQLESASASTIGMLRDASSFEKTRGNLAAAHAHLSVALRLAPRDASVQIEYRTIGAELAGMKDKPEETNVEELERSYRANPSDDLARSLARALEREGRVPELIGLLLSRLEDASPEKRAKLATEARAILERLAHGEHEALVRDALKTI